MGECLGHPEKKLSIIVRAGDHRATLLGRYCPELLGTRVDHEREIKYVGAATKIPIVALMEIESYSLN